MFEAPFGFGTVLVCMALARIREYIFDVVGGGELKDFINYQ